jgi:hypothetical protein
MNVNLEMIGKKYCKEWGRDYSCKYDELSPEQLEELGLKSWGSYTPPKRSDLVFGDLCVERVKELEKETPSGMIRLYHGTSSEYPIIKEGFKISTGALGNGSYFTRAWNAFDDGTIDTPISYAKQFDNGIVYTVLVPSDEIHDDRDVFELEKCDDSLTNDNLKIKCKKRKIKRYSKLRKVDLVKECCKEIQSLMSLQSEVPPQVEDFFNREGEQFNTATEMHEAYRRLGNLPRNYALNEGIKAYDDGSQVIVHDVDWLNTMKREAILECETEIPAPREERLK